MPKKKSESRVTIASRAVVEVQATGIFDKTLHREACLNYLEKENAGEDEFAKLEILLQKYF